MEQIASPTLSELHKEHKARQQRIRSAAVPSKEPPPPHVNISLPVNYFDVILNEVCAYFKVRKEDILSPRRINFITEKRHLLAYMMYWLTNYSFPQIGLRMGRDHTTILYAIRKVQENMALHRNDIEELEKRLLPLLPQKKK